MLKHSLFSSKFFRFVFVTSLCVFFFSSVSLVKAITLPTAEEEKTNQADKKENQSGWELRNMAAKMAGVDSLVSGNEKLAAVKTDASGKKTQRPTGATANLGMIMAQMIKQPPASSEEYIAHVLKQSPLVPQAYAQGIGFKSMVNIFPIWQVFLNLSYLFFILIFLVLGFMIMFRKKLGGQVVTIASAIPNAVITLLLVTFSYAIAGLIIDIMYLSIYLIVGVFGQLVVNPNLMGKEVSLTEIALSNNIWENGLVLVFGKGGTITEDSVFGGQVTKNVSVVGSASYAVSSIVESFFNESGIIGSVGGIATNIVAHLVFSLAVFFAVVKTFFELLKSYVTYVINVVFSPFILIMGAIKGNNEFVNWVKGLVQALAPFPVVIVMIFLAMAFGSYGKDNIGYKGDANGGFVPPQLSLPLVTDPQGGTVNAIQGLIAIGIVMLIPEAVKMSKDAIGAKSFFEKYVPDIEKSITSAFPLGGRVGMGGIGGAVGAGVGGAVGAARGLFLAPDNLSPTERVRHIVKQTSTTAADYGTRGAGLGVRAAGTISRSQGYNQPDVLNPITSAIDKRLNPDEAKRQEFLQNWEDAAQRALSPRKK